MMTKEQLERELEIAAMAIDYHGRDWHALEQWLRAKQWLIALSLAGSQPELQATHNRGRFQLADELLRLRDTNAKPSED